MKKAVLSDVKSFTASIVFFAIIALFLMVAYIITFRRKDGSLLPG
jgi:hypothetical protein